MIRADIATAALNDQIEQRVRIAASLLLTTRIDTSISPINAKVRLWDGTRCDLLIADLSDAYGRHVSALAKKRGTSVLAIDGDPAGISPQCDVVPASSPAPVLAKHMRNLLTQGKFCAPAAPSLCSMASALCALAGSPYRGRPVDAMLNGLTIHIRPETGRVYATTPGDLLSASDSFSSADWTLSVSQQNDGGQPDDGASRSLEAFLLQSAFQGRDQLPDFPEGRYRLKEWPDVGSAPELIDALKVAKALLHASASADELRRRCRMDARDVNASLWAYQAANLLDVPGGDEVAASAAPAQPVGAFSGMLARIANRFGLGRT